MRQKDQQRLRQLQQTLADLEQEEKQLTSERLQRDTHSNGLTFAQNTLANISQVTIPIPNLGMKNKYPCDSVSDLYCQILNPNLTQIC